MALEDLRARDLMTSKVTFAERHETLRTAVGRMIEHSIHGLLIAPDRPLHGYSILTGKDCIDAICEVGDAALDELCVEDAMTRPAITIASEMGVMDCMRLMRNAGVRTAPVVSGIELVGILTFTDVLRVCARSGR